jgi:hypothetical protein
MIKNNPKIIFAIILCIAFTIVSGCTIVSDPIEGCWYTSIMGIEMYLQFNSGGSAYISTSMGVDAMVWEKVADNHYILYSLGNKNKKYDVYYEKQTQSILLDFNQKIMFSDQSMKIRLLKTKCRE